MGLPGLLQWLRLGDGRGWLLGGVERLPDRVGRLSRGGEASGRGEPRRSAARPHGSGTVRTLCPLAGPGPVLRDQRPTPRGLERPDLATHRQSLEHGGHDLVTSRLGICNPDRSGRPSGQVLRLALQTLGTLNERAHERQEQLAVLRHVHDSGRSLEEHGPDGVLDASDRCADRLLANVEALSGMCEVPLLSQRQEYLGCVRLNSGRRMPATGDRDLTPRATPFPVWLGGSERLAARSRWVYSFGQMVRRTLSAQPFGIRPSLRWRA